MDNDGFEKLAALLRDHVTSDAAPSGGTKSRLDELLQNIRSKKKDTPGVPAHIEQAVKLDEFAGMPSEYPVGSFVRRNRFGRERYKYPSKGFIGRIAAVYPYRSDSAEDWVNATIHVILESGKIVPYQVDLRFYQAVQVERPAAATPPSGEVQNENKKA